MNAFFCVEDPLSRIVFCRLISELIGEISLTELQPTRGGFGWIIKRFRDYCTLANQYPVFILTDLDNAACAPTLRTAWIEQSGVEEPLPIKLSFNIAITEVEGWLLADRENLGEYLGLSPALLQVNSEIPNPKEFLLKCVSRKGSREAKSELLPKGNAKVGLGYNAFLSRFASDIWDFNSAAEHNNSLRRAIDRLTEFRELGA